LTEGWKNTLFPLNFLAAVDFLSSGVKFSFLHGFIPSSPMFVGQEQIYQPMANVFARDKPVILILKPN
jgi:hypothetical protein